MSVAALMVALAVVFPDPATGQGTRALAEAIAAGVMTYSDGSMPRVLCIRLRGADGGADAGEIASASGMALVASIRGGGDRASTVWLDLPGPGLGRSLTCNRAHDDGDSVGVQPPESVKS